MKEIDPDVAAILNDLPPVKLPEALVNEGWGHDSMASAYGGRLVGPSTETQPVYDHNCVQCGRPITMGRRQWWLDHAGNRWCTNVLLDREVAPYHIADHELKYWQTADAIRPRRVRKVSELKKPAGPCGARNFNLTQVHASHPHHCEHTEGHFGFHECHVCHHLWR